MERTGDNTREEKMQERRKNKTGVELGRKNKNLVWRVRWRKRSGSQKRAKKTTTDNGCRETCRQKQMESEGESYSILRRGKKARGGDRKKK